MPATAGIQGKDRVVVMAPRFRGDDERGANERGGKCHIAPT
jgi:hypothetical protein